MSLEHLLADIICQTFVKSCGRWQTKKPEAERKAMLVSFGVPIEYDKEEGYRYLDLVIYGPMNYVGVFVRDRWTIIPLQDLEYTEDGDARVKQGRSYRSGTSEWKRLSYHDSGWREAVQTFIHQNRDKLSVFSGNSDSFFSLMSLGDLNLNLDALGS